MIEFLQSYGLWIALAAVFFAMHRFGMVCCRGQKHRLAQDGQGPADKRLKDETPSVGAQRRAGTPSDKFLGGT
jgi:hypothetical protein